MSYLLATYETEDLIPEAEAAIKNFKQRKHTSAVRYSEVMWEKAVRCGRFDEEACLKKVFIGGLHEPVRLSMRSYWRAHKEETLQSLAQYAAPLIRIRKWSNNTRTPSRNICHDQRKTKKPTTQGKNTPMVSIKEHRGSNWSLSSSKKYSHLKNYTSDQESHKLTRKYQQLAAIS